MLSVLSCGILAFLFPDFESCCDCYLAVEPLQLALCSCSSLMDFRRLLWFLAFPACLPLLYSIFKKSLTSSSSDAYWAVLSIFFFCSRRFFSFSRAADWLPDAVGLSFCCLATYWASFSISTPLRHPGVSLYFCVNPLWKNDCNPEFDGTADFYESPGCNLLL